MTVVETSRAAPVADKSKSIRVTAEIAESLRVLSGLTGESIQSICTRLMAAPLAREEAEAMQRRSEGRPQPKRRRKSSGAGDPPAGQEGGES
jgi:hypothetical protein